MINQTKLAKQAKRLKASKKKPQVRRIVSEATKELISEVDAIRKRSNAKLREVKAELACSFLVFFMLEKLRSDLEILVLHDVATSQISIGLFGIISKPFIFVFAHHGPL